MDTYLARLRDRCQECISYTKFNLSDLIFKDIYNEAYFTIPNQKHLDKEIAKVLLYPSTEQAYFRNTKEASYFLQCYCVFQMGNNLQLDYLITQSQNVWHYFQTACAYYLASNIQAFELFKDEFMLQNDSQKKSYFANDLDATITDITQYTTQQNIEKCLEVIAQKNITQRTLIQRIPNKYNQMVRQKMDLFYLNIYQRLENRIDTNKDVLYMLFSKHRCFSKNLGILPYKYIHIDVQFFKQYLFYISNQNNLGIPAILNIVTKIQNSIVSIATDFLPLLMVAKSLKNLGILKEAYNIFEILQRKMNSLPNGLYSEYLPYIYFQIAKISLAFGKIENGYNLLKTLQNHLDNNQNPLYKIDRNKVLFLQLLISTYLGQYDQTLLQKCSSIKKDYYKSSALLLEFNDPQYLQKPFSLLEEDFIFALERLDRNAKVGQKAYYKSIQEYIFRSNEQSLQIRGCNQIFKELLILMPLIQLYDYRKIYHVCNVNARLMIQFLRNNKVLPKDWIKQLLFYFGEYERDPIVSQQERDFYIVGYHYECTNNLQSALLAYQNLTSGLAKFRQADIYRLMGNSDEANKLYQHLLDNSQDTDYKEYKDYKAACLFRLNQSRIINVPDPIPYYRNSSENNPESLMIDQTILAQSVIILEDPIYYEEIDVIPPIGIRQDIWQLKTILDTFANPELDQLMTLFIEKTKILTTTSQEINQSILIEKIPLGTGGFGRVNQVTFRGQKYASKITQFNLASRDIQNELLHLRQRLQEIIILCETLSYQYVAQIEFLGFILGQKSQFDYTLRIYTITQIYKPSSSIMNSDDSVKEKFAFQLAQVLNQLNYHRITHQDLKPDNLMLDKNGDLVVIDFGISVINYQSHFVNGPYSFTQRYADPNLMMDGYQSSKNDVYSYGLVLYFFFSCGAKPFSTGQTSDFLEIRAHVQNLSMFPAFIRGIIENATQRQLQLRKSFNQIIYDFLNQELVKHNPTDDMRQFFAMMELNFSQFYLDPNNLDALLELSRLQKELQLKSSISQIMIKINLKPTNLKQVTIDQTSYLIIEESVDYSAKNQESFDKLMMQIRIISNIHKLNVLNVPGILKLKHLQIIINTQTNTCKFTYLYDKMTFQSLQIPQQFIMGILQVLNSINKQNYILRQIPEKSFWITTQGQVIICNLQYLQETKHIKQNMSQSLNTLYITDSLKIEALQNSQAIVNHLKTWEERPDQIITQLEAGVSIQEILDQNNQQQI